MKVWRYRLKKVTESLHTLLKVTLEILKIYEGAGRRHGGGGRSRLPIHIHIFNGLVQTIQRNKSLDFTNCIPMLTKKKKNLNILSCYTMPSPPLQPLFSLYFLFLHCAYITL